MGGLGIFRKIKLFLPYEDIVYYADNKNAPYGNKSEDKIKELTLNSLKLLEKKGCDIIVVACNTATTSGIDYYRKQIKAHIIGVVPVVKTAAQMTTKKRIAVLATKYTIQSRYLDDLIKKFAPKIKVKKIACEGWVKAIENNTVTDALLKKCLKNISNEDVVVLGCTHFTLIKGHIQRLLGPDAKVVSSNDAVARHVMRVGMKYRLLSNKPRKSKYIYLCSDNSKKYTDKIKQYV